MNTMAPPQNTLTETGVAVGPDGQPLPTGTHQIDGQPVNVVSNFSAAPEPAQNAAPPQSTVGLMHNQAVDALRANNILPNQDPASPENAGILDAMGNLITTELFHGMFGDEGPNVARAAADVTNITNQRRAEMGLDTVPQDAVVGAVRQGIENALAIRAQEQGILNGQVPAGDINAIPQTPEAQAQPQAAPPQEISVEAMQATPQTPAAQAQSQVERLMAERTAPQQAQAPSGGRSM